jgi:hypothetical protein
VGEPGWKIQMNAGDSPAFFWRELRGANPDRILDPERIVGSHQEASLLNGNKPQDCFRHNL